MEWIHSHIALEPRAAEQRLQTVLRPLISVDCDEAAGEERWRNATRRPRARGRSATVALAEWDGERAYRVRSSLARTTPQIDWLMSEKLYGREREVGDATRGLRPRRRQPVCRSCVLMSGYPASANPSVVNELHKALDQQQALFAAGKFDQYKRDIPYATLAQAIQSLVCQVLGQERGRGGLVAEGRAGGRLVRMAGWSSSLVPDLAGAHRRPAARSRTCRPGRAEPLQCGVPAASSASLGRQGILLCLFLDDLQWLDRATLDLMQHLLAHEGMRQMMLIGAYRDNEVMADHPLMLALKETRSGGDAAR